jgi:hypothetical protein
LKGGGLAEKQTKINATHWIQLDYYFRCFLFVFEIAMVLFSLTVNIDTEIEEDWLEWMRQTFIPSLWLTGFFQEKRFLRLLGDHEQGGSTYSLQLTLDQLDKMKQFEALHLQDFREILYGKYAGRLVDFYTILEKVDI